MPSAFSNIDAFFSPDGALARTATSYVYREAQVTMANRIAQAIRDDRKSIVIEASTGTGKSFAYLATALLSGKRTIVSTATKTLQDQLFQKDLPVVLKAIAALNGKRPTALVLKGRSNYACLKKVDERAFQPELFSGKSEENIQDLIAWVNRTETGDFAELTHIPENSPILAAFDARSEHCVGQSCSFYQDCFVTQQRRQAQKVDLLIVNHALMCTDGAIRAKSAQAQGDESCNDSQTAITSQILPDFDLWIIDEAHAFADVATRNFGITLTETELRQLVNDLLYIAAFLTKKSNEALSAVARELTIYFVSFVETILNGKTSSPMRFAEGIDHSSNYAFDRLLEAFREVDIALIQAVQSEVEYAAELKMLSRRIHDILVQANYIVKGAAEKSGYLIVAEKDSRGSSLCAWPINPGSILRTHLWNMDIPVVMTSATLAFNGSTRTFRRQMGLLDQDEDENAELILPPIFDFENRSALYVAKHLPNPNDAGFAAMSHDEIRFLVNLSGGGTLVLFTSHRALGEAYLALRDEFIEKGLRVFKQGDAPKLALIRDFVRADQISGGVLFATHSFWEGVDIPGKSLRMVVIDKLPFHSISDPLFEARMNDCEKRGGAPFQELALPEAALTLKQGFGRLLRKNDDAGLAVLLDSRALTKNYGKQILKSLVSMPVFSKREDVENVWNHHIKKLIGSVDALT